MLPTMPMRPIGGGDFAARAMYGAPSVFSRVMPGASVDSPVWVLGNSIAVFLPVVPIPGVDGAIWIPCGAESVVVPLCIPVAFIVIVDGQYFHVLV